MPRQYLSERALAIMRSINRLGYYFPKNEADVNLLRGLKQKEIMQLHLARIGGKWICYLEGKNAEALKAFLERYHMNYLTVHKLAQIRDVFGLREERYKRKYSVHKKTKSKESRNARLDQF
ncbi:MAG: hypothetical protein M1433_02760 [Candidatus Parvarchaeota archaeon]|nr:hypothetical protein [Candidatus Parvarchaeota archaeon]